MILIRKFEFAEHKEYGINGWKPMWMKGADPITGQGVPHDILEHHPNMELGAEAEFHALGASWWIRGENGYFMNGSRAAADNYASDFVNILERVSNGEETLHSPCKTRRIDPDFYGDADERLVEIVTKGIRLARDEYEDEEYKLMLPRDAHERILGWMRKGYRYAYHRFSPTIDPCSLCCLFERTTERVSRLTEHAEVGMVMRVKLDLRQHEVTAFADYPEEAY